ncbi:MAG TPA: sulfurtransferase TusA family protein [Thermoanaerobaculia bacterium]|nr:sulfurtransferase TusA family protein [Thermoanaerobaculia bacterium]
MTKRLDVRGMKCPIPIVRAKKELDTLAVGDILEVIATDPGSMADFRGWVKTAKHAALREQREDTDETGTKVFVHVLEKTASRDADAVPR